jgi:hypothetical protein
MNLRILPLSVVLVLIGICAQSFGAVIVNLSSLGMYNNLGTVLDGTSVFLPANSSSGPVTNIPEPNLSAASALLGNWLTSPQSLNANWTGPQLIPATWPVNTDNAIIYSFGNALTSFTNLNLSINVDNSAFVWLDGTYVTGFRVIPANNGALNFSLPNLGAGVHYLQILREDFGGATGTPFLELTGTPQIVVDPVPEPASLTLWGLGALGCAIAGYRRRKLAA